MSLLQIDRLSKAFGTNILFEPFSAQVSRGDRIALVGDNGVGKSTLLRMIAGVEEPSEGACIPIGGARIGYLPQVARIEGGDVLWTAVESAFADDRAVERELRRLETAIAEHADEKDLHRYDELLHRFAQRGGYEIEAKVRAALDGVGFGESEYNKPVGLLSGGEEARAALARALLEDPEVLLLDEPTNHLDFSALDWLEEQLAPFDGALVLVSHDRHLLERVSNRTWEIAFGQVSTYRVGYGASRSLRDAERRRQLERFEEQEETIERYRDFIRRHKAGQKHRQAKDRERKLERIESERIEEPKEAKRIALRIAVGRPSGKRVLALRDLAVGFDRALFSCPDTELARGEKVAIIGPNGCGKSTTFRTLFGLLAAREGSVAFDGEDVTNKSPADLLRRGITFVPQGRHVFPLMTVRENLELGAYIRRDRRQIQEDLDRVYGLFPLLKERAKQKGGSLSGGEMQTLEMGRAMLLNPRLMFLDEPSLGLSPLMANQVFDKVEEIRAAGSTMLIVEQNADRSLKMSDFAYVFETGKNKYEGPAEEIRNNEEVKRLYLGG